MADGRPLIVKKALLFLTFVTHLVACSLYTKALAKYLYALYRLRVTYAYTDWTRPWVYEPKPMELMWFTLAFALLYLCFFGWAFVYRRLLPAAEERVLAAYLPLVALNGACLGGVGIIANRREVPGAGLAGATALVAVMALSVALQSRASARRRLAGAYAAGERLVARIVPVSGKVLAGFFVLALLLLSRDLLPLVFGDGLVLKNEFVELSERTVIGGQSFDDHAFIQTRLAYPEFESVDEFLGAEYSRVASDRGLQAALRGYRDGEDPTVEKFVDLNARDFRWQLMNRSFDLHNDQTMNPLNAWMLGVPLAKTHNLYGLVIPTLSRLYFRLVRFGYDNWLRLAFFLEWFYFVSIPVGIYLYTRSRELTFAVFVTLVGTSFYGMYEGYFYLVNTQIPINPIRHGLDFLAIVALGRCVDRRDVLSTALLGVTCVLAILLGDHFGLATTAAAAITLFVLFLSGPRRARNLLALAVVTGLALASFKYSNLSGPNRSVRYFLDGYFSWPSKDAIQELLVLYAAVYLGLFYLYVTGRAGRTWYLVLFLSLYSNILGFHYVWHGQKADFVSLTVLAVLVPCLVQLALESFRLERWAAPALLAVSLAAFPANFVAFRASKRAYDREVQGHELHRWTLDTARFRTTMPPEPFAASVDLVRRYSAGDAGIYLISKYDYMLPVLARKYSRMEYPNLAYFLITAREVEDVERQLETERPRILFVDSDVMLDGQLWTVNNFLTLSDPGYFYENRLRLSRLNELKKIFLKVRDDYRLVEKGPLLSVYERRERS